MQKNILKQWDNATRYGKFPHMGSNSNHIFGKARMLVYRSNNEWLVLIELIIFLYGIDNFTNLIYAFGNKLKSPGFFDENIMQGATEDYRKLIGGIHIPEEVRITIDSNESWCPDLHDFALSVNGTTKRFSYSLEDYLNKNIQVPIEKDEQCIRETKAVVRMLSESLSEDELFFPEDKLLLLIGKEKLSKFLKVWDWENPGLGDMDIPSDSPSLVRLASAISENRPGDYFCSQDETNTHWSKWPDENPLYWKK
ncbi:MAG: hypothetical protein HND51_01175 [Chloroflexi bacterium]|nr:hypothetical protein [Chloroflexota bacterium]